MPKFFKRKKAEDEVVVNEIPLTTVFRWYLYDTGLVENINDLAEMVGLSRISEEGEEKELEDSEDRLKELKSLYNFIEAVSDMSSQVLTAIHLNEIVTSEGEDAENLEERGESMLQIYKAVALSTLIGAFSTSLSLGMIQNNMVRSTIFELGDIDE